MTDAFESSAASSQSPVNARAGQFSTLASGSRGRKKKGQGSREPKKGSRLRGNDPCCPEKRVCWSIEPRSQDGEIKQTVPSPPLQIHRRSREDSSSCYRKPFALCAIRACYWHRTKPRRGCQGSGPRRPEKGLHTGRTDGEKKTVAHKRCRKRYCSYESSHGRGRHRV